MGGNSRTSANAGKPPGTVNPPGNAGPESVCAAASRSSRAAAAMSGRCAGSARSSASMTGPSGPADGARGAGSWATPAKIAAEPPGRSNGPRPSTAV